MMRMEDFRALCGWGLFLLVATTGLLAQQSATSPSPPPPSPAQTALIADLLKAPDETARGALLDAHHDDVNEALRLALRQSAERLRVEGHLTDSVAACQAERLTAIRLQNPRAVVNAEWGEAQAQSLLGDYDRALEVLNDAKAITISLHDDKLQRQTLANIAIIYRLRGNLDQAIELQHQLLKAFEADNDTRDIGRTLNNICILQQQRGEFREALAAGQRSLTMEEPDTAPYARTLHAIAGIYLSQGELDLAYDWYQKALAQRNLETTTKIPSLEMLGEVERQRHHYDEAARYLAQAHALVEATQQQPQLAFVLRIEALVQADRGDKAGAIPLLERSLEIGRAIKDPDLISYTLSNLAVLRRELGQPEAGLALAREAIAIGDSQSAQGLAQAYSEAGLAYIALGQRDEGRKALQACIDIIEDLRDQVSGSGIEKQQFLEHAIEPYRSMMALLLDEGSNEAALGYAERTRARALLDEMQRGHVDLARALTPDEREQARAVERRVQKAKGPARHQAREDLAAWRARLFAAHPELRLASGAAEIPSLSQLRELVPDASTVVLAYAAVEDRTWLFEITSGGASSSSPGLTVHRLAIDNDTLSKRVHHLRDSLANRSLDFSTEARGLYAELLQPADAALRRARRVVIIPDGVLWDLPFQVLQAPAAPHPYVIERSIVEYAPSLTFLWEARHNRTTAPREGLRDLLAVGNAQFEQEPRALAALYGPRKTTLLIGAAASEQRVKTDAGRYRVLHFATHGLLDDRDPMYSAVLLAPPALKGDADDGRLEAREMMDVHLNADLVVLSACDTARGRYGAGEGLLGLSWAMLIAGSRDVVVSQWKVDASSTAQLMIAFHRGLVHQGAAGQANDIGAALQRAAREVMRDPRYRHPFYWAAFRTVGLGHS